MLAAAVKLAENLHAHRCYTAATTMLVLLPRYNYIITSSGSVILLSDAPLPCPMWYYFVQVPEVEGLQVLRWHD
jgi:hypothetical protein